MMNAFFPNAAPDDFTGIPNMELLFNQSTRRVMVNVSITDDTTAEGIETFQASLTLVSPLLPNIIVSPNLTTISIVDIFGESSLPTTHSD